MSRPEKTFVIFKCTNWDASRLFSLQVQYTHRHIEGDAKASYCNLSSINIRDPFVSFVIIILSAPVNFFDGAKSKPREADNLKDGRS